ncbi:hypothetical protein EAS64_28910 [Trebonia kvetii]|uniref:Uncharacterized protein n=1 Tax=Trebonia kvetii TaxID=2480626 RepID=A0A6P2BR79_9ACTN|nr:hypothetical protein [Trebonia kvetii]TVZ01524.1 hypothetical protein EAS64_28910 [Trebonia kvetii]
MTTRRYGPDEADLSEIVAESTLRWHEWEIAAALRDITELRRSAQPRARPFLPQCRSPGFCRL